MGIDFEQPPVWRRYVRIWGADATRDVDEELSFHLESRVAELVAEGWSAEAARRAARERFGDVGAVRAQCRRLSEERERTMRRTRWFAEIGQDLRYGWRNLRSAPAFGAVAVLSLAVGIGANTAIFGLLHTVLLARLPVPDPGQLVSVQETVTMLNTSVSLPLVSQEQFLALQSVPGLTLAASAGTGMQLRAGGDRIHEGVQLVDGSFFPVVGVQPLLGRFISPEDDRAGAPVIVVSEPFWKAHLGGSASAIGQTVAVNETPFTVIGVTPARYRGVYAFGNFTAAIPLSTAQTAGVRDFRAEPHPSLVNVGRLDPAVSITAVQSAVRNRLRDCCGQGAAPTAAGETAPQNRYQVVEISRGITGKVDARAQYATLMYTLMGGVLVLLLVACANVGTLLLARAETRRAELAVRYSLGALRSRLVRQLLTESFQLAVMGALLGYLFARWGVVAIAAQLPPSVTPLSELMALRPDRAVLGFTVLITVACSVLFGVLPAWRATRVDVVRQLKEGGQRTGGRRTGALDRVLITAQVALALLLVTTAGLLVQTLRNLRRIDAGFDGSQLLLVQVDARGTPYERTGVLPLQEALLDRIRRLPAVRSAALSSTVPVFGGNIWINRVGIPGYVAAPDEVVRAFVNSVTPGYFEAAGIAVRRGRDFSPADRAGTDRVAIVSESFARQLFAGAEPLGRVLQIGDSTLRVVGVAADARYMNLREPEQPLVYLAVLQQPGADRLVLSVRTVGEPSESAELIRAQVAAVAPGLSPRRMVDMEDAIDEALVRERLAALLGTLFGIFALCLAALGLYGVIAYAVAGRTVEIGTRMALGAQRGRVLWLVLRQSLVMLTAGFALGVPLALLAARALGTQLYGVQSFDPLSLGAALLVLGVTGMVASWLPARRATRVDPLAALRSS